MGSRSSCVLGPGAGSQVDGPRREEGRSCPRAGRPPFRGRRGGRGEQEAGREARARPAGSGGRVPASAESGGLAGRGGNPGRGGGGESGLRSKGKHVCRAMAPAGAGCRGHSRGSPRPPPARPARGPSPRPSLLPEGPGLGRHSLQLPPSTARISFQPSFRAFQASSFQTRGRGRGEPAAPGSAALPHPPGEWPGRRAPRSRRGRSFLPAWDLRAGPAVPLSRLRSPASLPSALPRALCSPSSLPLPLTHPARNRDRPCFPVSPLLGKLRPLLRPAPRTGRRALDTAHRTPRTEYRAPGGASWVWARAESAPSRDPPSSRLSRSARGRSPGLRSPTPRCLCSALARLAGPQRSRGWKSGAAADSAGLAPRTRPPPRTLGPVRRRRGRSSHPGSDLGASRARGVARTARLGWARGPEGRGARGAEKIGGRAQVAGGRKETQRPRLSSAGRLSGLERVSWRFQAEALRERRGPPPKVPISQGLRSVVRSVLEASESEEQSSTARSERFPGGRADPGLAPLCACVSRGEGVRGQTWQVSDDFTWRVTVPPP